MHQYNILFFTEEVKFRLTQKKRTRAWIGHCISIEEKLPGILNYIFCSDSYLLGLNLKYLGHNTLTDILTFSNSDIPDEISGDIFISTERVKENSVLFNTGYKNEMNRVMIHGVLHLCGYRDKSKSEKLIMRQKEDYYLSLLPNF